jgi:hypothetical protein
MKNSNDTIRNRTRDLPACSSVPQPPLAPNITDVKNVKFPCPGPEGIWPIIEIILHAVMRVRTVLLITTRNS